MLSLTVADATVRLSISDCHTTLPHLVKEYALGV